MEPFRNEPVLELRRASERAKLEDGMVAAATRIPLRVPVLIGGDARHGDELTSTDPGTPSRVVATSALATEAEVGEAVRTADRAYASWSQRPAEERAAALVRAAAWMRERRHEIAALILREAGKPWAEADADVCEAIDFCEFYARGALALAQGKPLFQVPGERNAMTYRPRGVTGVIAPWNFPAATMPIGIATGKFQGETTATTPRAA